ncbi:N-acetylmuramoyl-L-alanine amidase [Mesobacillus subterraneus]|uniref:N-acetylmuramoyl-L-alanine amidase n=1 Tax=Mesobacillus subterraneus TaxID=285983 RepID=A0A3R9DVN1_9BACI|nr:N-acetylmuramoyl-L-alanine amidase [Mesobacillus subterraneus]RSD28400.1 N-acetylmuramoyl-L-alanine amidase [Mesobacillus subterraneus]
MKLYLDAGHGGSDPGAQGNGLREKDLTLDIALKIRSILQNGYVNIEVRMSRTSDITKSMRERTDEANAWGADFYLSIHINAFNGAAQGYEDFIYSGLSDSSATARYRDIIHAEVMKLNQLNDRGKKKADFHVLRESSMDAMLSENGFIDNTRDANLMKQDSWLSDVAQGHANGIARAFNLTPKQNSDRGSVMYRVIAGSFKERSNADRRVTTLKGNGIDSFVTTETISGETWYRVQAGAFSSRENAESRVRAIERLGIDAFVTTA